MTNVEQISTYFEIKQHLPLKVHKTLLMGVGSHKFFYKFKYWA